MNDPTLTLKSELALRQPVAALQTFSEKPAGQIVMYDWKNCEGRLDAVGVIGSPVEPEVYSKLSQKWLEKFCSGVKEQTGEWVYGGYRWHAYTYGFESAMSGDEAWASYRAKEQSQYLVHFESEHFIFDCVGPPCPDLQVLHDDIYLFPLDMSWSMVFTHEVSTGIGPFFVSEENRCGEQGAGIKRLPL